jgi:cell division septum initiation protein DivIVA
MSDGPTPEEEEANFDFHEREFLAADMALNGEGDYDEILDMLNAAAEAEAKVKAKVKTKTRELGRELTDYEIIAIEDAEKAAREAWEGLGG